MDFVISYPAQGNYHGHNDSEWTLLNYISENDFVHNSDISVSHL